MLERRSLRGAFDEHRALGEAHLAGRVKAERPPFTGEKAEIDAFVRRTSPHDSRAQPHAFGTHRHGGNASPEPPARARDDEIDHDANPSSEPGFPRYFCSAW